MHEIITPDEAAILAQSLALFESLVDRFNTAGWAATSDKEAVNPQANMLGLIRTSERFRSAHKLMRDAIYSADIHGLQKTVADIR